MKKFLYVLRVTVLSVILVPLSMYLLWLTGTLILYAICGASLYRKSGEAAAMIGGKRETLNIYKAENKPFLLVGPRWFESGDFDFFFVNKRQVVRTATDKGGDEWLRLGRWLYIVDDLTGDDDHRLRAPTWDNLRGDPESSVKSRGEYIVFSFRLDCRGRPVRLLLPQKLFTPDMDTADNCTRRH